MRNTFKRYERLKREQHIDTLFLTGKAYSVLPVRIVYLLVPRPDAALPPVLAGFSVPRKKFASSVQRHRIRRLMVEAWRLHKHGLCAAIPAGRQLHIFFIFTGTALPDYATVQAAMIKGIDRLKDTVLPG